jgi:hypothetical protein
MILEIESEAITTETYSFLQYSNSLMKLAEANHNNHRVFADVEKQLDFIVNDYMLKVQQAIEHKIRFSVKVISSVQQIIDAHEKWSDLRKEVEIINKNRDALFNLLSEAQEYISNLAEVLGEIDETVSIPEPEGISYESIENIDTVDGSHKQKIFTHLIANSPLSEAEELAKLGNRVLLVQAQQNHDDNHAILQERYSTPSKMKIGLLSLAPLPLSLPKYSRLIDEQATNMIDDKTVVLNIRGYEALKKRLFLAFSVAQEKEYDVIVFDCSFGEGEPYKTNPGNLGYAFVAATDIYVGKCIKKLVIAGNFRSDYCKQMAKTMGQFRKRGNVSIDI